MLYEIPLNINFSPPFERTKFFDSKINKHSKIALKIFKHKLINFLIIKIFSFLILNKQLKKVDKLIEQKVIALISTLEGSLHRIVLSYSNVFQVSKSKFVG